MAKKRPPWFLKLIIFKLFIQGIFVFPLAIGLLTLIGKDLEKFTRSIVRIFDLDVNNDVISLLLDKIGMARTTLLVEVSIGLLLYGTLCLVEAYGLHRRRRWAEYLTVGAVSLFIPFEIYEVIQKVSFLLVAILVLNIAIVAYLIRHKELFPQKTAPPTK